MERVSRPLEHMIDKILVVAAVIRKNESILLCLRPQHKRHGGLWEFPGGKVHPGETLVEAICREMREELLVEATSSGEILFIAHDKGSPYEIHFIATELVGKPTAHEHDTIEWINIAICDQYPLAPCDHEFVQKFFKLTE
jgi:mutator protein MutT